ncbi:AAA family ATPase [Crassaminicella thermophila]|uniref:Nuclease SbcCD subunit C n=1 Tax=Crassaminicella thermophila TaxID=2599308 RepID=A0A5C0SEY4_CRATE|nr:AAA family ATPase [Crassaminicella thermophila]QEK12336.1 AAA family ATPase [Crassaminicella thermophila]
MGSKMRILKLTLVGTRKDYEVVFNKGLNYISGPTSTGKTTILEMINYALGSKKHKDYIEIGQSCTCVELEILIENKRYKIQRQLFDFNKKVKVYQWDDIKADYSKEFTLLEVDGPSNPKSLSAFLLDRINLSNIKIVNQDFSFRDLFKYSYLKQIEIDNENIMGEKIWYYDIKRKPTFEIIFNIYDELLQDLKASLKLKKEELMELEIKLRGIREFLESVEIVDLVSFIEEKGKLENEREDKIQELCNIKQENDTYDKENTLKLQNKILNLKNEIAKIEKNIFEQNQYLKKLMLLRNQYNTEIERLEYIVEGHYMLNKYEYSSCPSCLQPIDMKKNGCVLCGSEDIHLSGEEILAFKHEKRKLSKKLGKLLNYIEEENNNLNDIEQQKSKMIEKLSEYEMELIHLHKGYVNPLIEKVEQLNYEIGALSKEIFQLEKNYRLIEKLNSLKIEYSDKNETIKAINNKIKDMEDNKKDKNEVINELSELFSNILSEFKFPKLSNAYIDSRKYLPYVRDRLYSDLGSLGAVTLITVAYYLAILILGIQNDNNHLGVLMIDSPRSNLGASSNDSDELFKDEEIFNSVVRSLVNLSEQFEEDIQLIIVNNGYPDFLSKEYIIKEFDGDGTKSVPYGLIDDINLS